MMHEDIGGSSHRIHLVVAFTLELGAVLVGKLGPAIKHGGGLLGFLLQSSNEVFRVGRQAKSLEESNIINTKSQTPSEILSREAVQTALQLIYTPW